MQQLLTENLLLSFVGCGFGLVLALWGTRLFALIIPADFPELLRHIPVDTRVLTFALAISTVSSIVFGLLPALRASRADLNEVLKEGARGSSGKGSGGRSILLIAEVALSFVLSPIGLPSCVHRSAYGCVVPRATRVQTVGSLRRGDGGSERRGVVPRNHFGDVREAVGAIAGVDALGRIADVEILLPAQPRALLEDRHADLLRRSGIDGRFVDHDRTGLEVLADDARGGFERREIGLARGVHRRGHGDDDDVGLGDRGGIGGHDEMTRALKLRARDFARRVLVALQALDLRLG